MKPENDTGTSGDQENLNASQILERVAETYASATAYQDSGCVTTTFTSINGVRVTETPFMTAFVRPDRFRFEYNYKIKSDWTREIVWRQGVRVKTTINMTQIRRNPRMGSSSYIVFCVVMLLFELCFRLDNALIFLCYFKQPGRRLDLALSRLTGVSSGSAHDVPSLLWPERRSGSRLTSLTRAIRMTDVTYDGVKCFCIHGQYCGRSTLLAIDCVTFLVRRIEQEYTLRRVRTSRDARTDVHTEQVTTYKPAIGQTIDPRLLAFDAT